MTEKTEALRLADALEDDLVGYDGGSLPRICQDIADAAAAELRRLAAVEAQRDALLEALRKIGKYTGEGPTYTTPWQDIVAEMGQTARAAIKAVEDAK